MSIRNRVVRYQLTRASDFRPAPHNIHKHPDGQKTALAAAIDELGFCSVQIARELPDGSLELIDGHARAELSGDEMLPTVVLDVNEHEAAKLLLTLDPIARLSIVDPVELDALLREVQFGEAALQQLMSDLATDAGLYDVAELDEPPELPNGDGPTMSQLTFTVHPDQRAVILAAIERAAQRGGGRSTLNDNANGNCLSAICEAYCSGQR